MKNAYSSSCACKNGHNSYSLSGSLSFMMSCDVAVNQSSILLVKKQKPYICLSP